MKAKRSMTGTILICLAGLTSFLAASVSAQTSSPDVGLITKLSGGATYWNRGEQKQPAPLQAFMKIRRGDHLKLPSASSLTLLYFASGRQETWKGPATIIAGDTESTVTADQKPPPQPEVKILPAKATRQIVGLPFPLPPASTSKSGVIQTMGRAPSSPAKTKPAPLSGDAQRNLKEAEKVYQDLKKTAEADDVTPELYFFSVLAKYKQFPEMAKVVDTMLQKKPGDAALKNLKAWVRSQSAPRR